MLPMRKFGNKNVVDWKAITKGFEFMINETRCEVVSNKMIEKVSKNGKARRERRLTVRAICSEATIEVSSTSFKAMSFTKRLNKAMKEVKQATYGLIIHPEWARFYEAQAIDTDEEYINSGKFNSLDLANSTSELKREYYKLCKIYHPDMGGSQEDFEMLQFCYDEAYRALRATEACMEELGISMEEYNRYFGC